MDYAYFNRSDLKSNENKSIFLNIHESMYRENEYGIDDDRKTNNINENYMSVKYLHYRNNSMISHIRNLNKSKSSKNYNSNIIINHERSLSASNGMSRTSMRWKKDTGCISSEPTSGRWTRRPPGTITT